MTGTARGALPDGFVVRLGDRVRTHDDGATLVGGAPTRVLYLTEIARALVVDRTITVVDARSRQLAETLLEAGLATPVLAELRLPGEQLRDLVTVVIPVRDRPAQLRRLLGSLGGAVPVIVVDDASLDPSSIEAVAVEAGARTVRLPANLGPAGARNAGLEHIATPFVAFVDSDMELDARTLPLLLRHFSDPRVALVAPRIAGLAPARAANWITRYDDARSSLDLGREPTVVRPGARASWLPAACLVGRVEALGAGFSPGMRVAEDVDLVWRLCEQGWRVRYEPAVEARHEHRDRLVDWLARKAFYGTGGADLGRRHGQVIAPAVYTPWTLVVVGALLAQRRWSVPVAAGAAVVAGVRIARRLRPARSRARVTASLVGMGAIAATAQTGELLLRHWWPITLVAGLASRRVRRAALVAAVADAVYEQYRTRARVNPLAFVVARRLDDLAYGAGLWWGAVRARSLVALAPVVRGRQSAR
ncbi:MAG: mycofactocin biosynthesis glycosyltransferase MftF [Microcella sp.]|uniref:mycofactocin biosynthesis glycosyltransferase MftF n=1 Tax=Microcella sp. TaxID=1913979 RepID=UPI00331598DA